MDGEGTMTDGTKKGLAAVMGAVAGLAAGLGSAAVTSPGGLAELVERLGLPVALLVIIVVALIYAGSWMAANVAKPLLGSHLRFMERAAAATEQQANAVQELQELAKVANGQHQLHHEQERRLLDDILKTLRSQSEKTEKKGTP